MADSSTAVSAPSEPVPASPSSPAQPESIAPEVPAPATGNTVTSTVAEPTQATIPPDPSVALVSFVCFLRELTTRFYSIYVFQSLLIQEREWTNAERTARWPSLDYSKGDKLLKPEFNELYGPHNGASIERFTQSCPHSLPRCFDSVFVFHWQR
jgi:hypothetical protein